MDGLNGRISEMRRNLWRRVLEPLMLGRVQLRASPSVTYKVQSEEAWGRIVRQQDHVESLVSAAVTDGGRRLE